MLNAIDSSHATCLKFREGALVPASLYTSFKMMPALRDLNISQCGVFELPDEIGDVLTLRRLDVTNNKLTKLPEAIGKLENLEALLATKNNVSTLPGELVTGIMVQELDLSKHFVQW